MNRLRVFAAALSVLAGWLWGQRQKRDIDRRTKNNAAAAESLRFIRMEIEYNRRPLNEIFADLSKRKNDIGIFFQKITDQWTGSELSRLWQNECKDLYKCTTPDIMRLFESIGGTLGRYDTENSLAALDMSIKTMTEIIDEQRQTTQKEKKSKIATANCLGIIVALMAL